MKTEGKLPIGHLPSAERQIPLVPGQGMTADILILAAIWLIFVLPFLVTHRTILPIDGHGVVPTGAYDYPEPRLPNYYTLDPDGAIGADIGFTKFVADSPRRGVIPFWNPYQGFGQQFLAEGGTQVLYPINWFNLLLPPNYWDLVKFLHLFLAASFFYLLGKECGLDRAHSIACGCCAYSAGFFQGYLALNMFAGFVWVPLILVAVERVLRSGRVRLALWPGAIGTFCLVTCCHPGLCLALTCMLAVYVAGRIIEENNLTALVKIMVPIGIGLLCAAPSWMPFVQNAYQAREILGPVRIILSLTELPTLLLPQLYAPIQHAGIFGDPAGSNGQYWRFGWIVPAMTYYGIAGIVFAVRKRGRRMLVCACTTIWLWLWIMLPGFNLFLYIPLLSRTTPYYLMGAIQVLLCVLCGYGISMLRRDQGRDWLWINLVWTALLLFLLAIAARVYYGLAHPDLNLAWKSAVPAVAWAVAVPLLTWFARRSGTVYLVAISALVANGIAYFPSGGDADTALWLRVWPLLAFLTVSIVIGVASLKPVNQWAMTIITLLGVNVVCVSYYHAWPKRYNPFTPSAFTNYLERHSSGWRSYGIDSYLFPDLASGFPFSTVNVLATLPPPAVCRFLGLFFDPYQVPGTFYGMGSPEPGSDGSPLHTLFKYKRYWDYAAVRYLVSNQTSVVNEKHVADLRATSPMQRLAAVPLDHPVEFVITPAEPIQWIDLPVSTFARANPGRLTFSLTDAKGATVIADSRDSSNLPDNKNVRYSRTGEALVQPGRYLATVDFKPERVGGMLAIWRDTVGSANYRYFLSTAVPFAQAFRDDPAGAIVWRNESAQPLIYVAPEAYRVSNWHEGQDRFGGASDLRRTAFLETGNDGLCESQPGSPFNTAAADVSNIRVEPNRVYADVNSKIGGTLALVMSYAQGWSARINGAPARVYRLNGTFIGACLAGPGKYQVTFEFEPPLWRLGLGCAALGLMLLVWMSISKLH